MARSPTITDMTHLHYRIPTPLFRKIQTELWSEAEMRIPYGKLQEFMTDLLTDYFSKKERNRDDSRT